MPFDFKLLGGSIQWSKKDPFHSQGQNTLKPARLVPALLALRSSAQLLKFKQVYDALYLDGRGSLVRFIGGIWPENAGLWRKLRALAQSEGKFPIMMV